MKDRAGFLLLEVMVTIVIVASSLLLIGRIYSASRNSIDRSLELFSDSLIIEDKIFALEEKGMSDKGGAEYALKGYDNRFWSVDIRPSGINGSALNEATVTAFRKAGSAKEGFSVTTLLKDKSAAQ